MSYKVGQGSIFGRIGTELGKGLAESIPKEAERYRLSKGLESLSQQQDLSPFEQFSKLAAIPGITPQMLQSGSELLKQQGTRQAYARKAAGGGGRLPPEEPVSPGLQALQDVNFANLPQGRQQIQAIQPGQQQITPEQINAPGQPQIVEQNPLRPEAQPRIPWSADRRDQEISRIFEEQPNITFPEAVNIASNNEERFLAQPKAIQEQDEYLRSIQTQADDEFTKQLETKLQKSGTGVYGDITGEMLNNLKRGIAKDLRINPNATVRDIANKWSNKALDLSKTKTQLDTLANRDIFDKILKGPQTLDKLKSYQKIFSETGNQEEFFNLMKSDFGFSPRAAATIAYPMNKKSQEYINQTKPTSLYPGTGNLANARKYAVDLENLITPNDSLLAISQALKKKHPSFNIQEFFNQLSEDVDNIGLTPRQKRELAEGPGDITPNWADLLIQ